MSLFVCAKCGCVDNTATSSYWMLTNEYMVDKFDYAKELQPYKGMGLCSECGRLATSPDGRDVVVPGKWHGKFPKKKATEEELKRVGYKNLIKIEKGDTMIYEEKRFMAVSEIEKECCTGCCFYDNGNCQLENPNCFNSGIIWVQKEDYMSEISEKAIKLAIEAMRPIPVYSSPCYSVIDNRSPEEKHEEDMRFCKEFNNLRCEMLIDMAKKIEEYLLQDI